MSKPFRQPYLTFFLFKISALRWSDNHLAALPSARAEVGKVKVRTNFIQGGRHEVLWHRPAR
ncbi:MAG: hypothetical protein Q8L40_02455, partial [Burkholderiales bacterium]|nr:hypothetical protein [Burkholderiales bacterium]